MRLFFDTEFSALRQNAQLLSLAFVDENGRAFYAECREQHRAEHDPWVKENVVAHMRWLALPDCPSSAWFEERELTAGVDSNKEIATRLAEWLSAYEDAELWADCPAYDWVLVCELFGGSLHLPKPLTYIVNDFATVLTWQGKDPLTARETLLLPEQLPTGTLHNALYDAQLLKACFQALSCKHGL